jgi:hypothetical protein
MTEKHLRYYYEIEYLGKERTTSNTVERRTIIESSAIAPQDFAFQPLETAKPIVAELEAVVIALQNNLPSDIETILDYTIERKDEFEEMFGITKTVPRLICKWTSYQTFTLTPKQEEIFKFIENQLMNISLKWGEWKTLFGPPYENLPLMQETAPTFFSIAREALMHEVMLSIRRLFDTDKMSGNENCTFDWLAKNLDQGNKRSEFEQALQLLKHKTAFLTAWRHKVLAHNDYEHGVNQQLLPKVELEKIDEIVSEMSSLMNIVQQNLSTNDGWRYMQYDSVLSRGGGDFLMNFLKRGIKERNEAIEMMKQRQDKWTEPPQ